MAEEHVSIGKRIVGLSSELGLYLSAPDAIQSFTELLADHPCWRVIRSLRGKTRRAVEVMPRLAVSSDCLTWVELAIRADAEMDDQEYELVYAERGLERAYDLVRDVADLFASELPDVYEQFASLAARQTEAFLQAFVNHDGRFGGAKESPTRRMGAALCAAASVHVRHSGPLDRYEELVVQMIERVGRAPGTGKTTRKLVGRFHE